MERYLSKIMKLINLGRDLADLSTCKRTKVGCVVFPMDCTEVLAIGYNGQPRGRPNNGCTGEEGSCGCVHAEVNAMIKLGIAFNCFLFTTTAPCTPCASAILNHGGIHAVLFDSRYRTDQGLFLLNDGEIETVRVMEDIGHASLRQWWALSRNDD